MGGEPEFFRLFHIDDFDTTERRFRSCAMPRSSEDKGVSSFCVVCAEFYSNSICGHLRKKKIRRREPPIFRKFRKSDLPAGFDVVQKTDEGDVCHHNIVGISEINAGDW